MAEPRVIPLDSARDEGSQALAIARELRVELDLTKARVLELVAQREVQEQVHATLLSDLTRQIKQVRAIAGRASAAAERIEEGAATLRQALRAQRSVG